MTYTVHLHSKYVKAHVTCATESVALRSTHAGRHWPQGRGAPRRLPLGGAACRHAGRLALAGHPLAPGRRHRSGERRARRVARAGLVEPPPHLRQGGGTRLGVRGQPGPGGPASDRPHPVRPHRGVDAGDPRRARGLVRVILQRCFAWNRRARPDEQDSPLWVPRAFQGDGRHDNPDLYGCLYLADREVSAVVEQLARFRTQRLQAALLQRRGLPLGLAPIELDDEAERVDLDDPHVLVRELLRPSAVATRQREVTQRQARSFHAGRPRTAALSWWSTFESSWANYTVFDRAVVSLSIMHVRELTVDDGAVTAAADFLGLRR